jgi:hypothetical protein
MDQHLLFVFKEELHDQCRLAAEAGEQLEQARGGYSVWSELQSIIVAAGNASKLLWPPGSGDATEAKRLEREPLREAAGVTDDSPLKSRKIRNAFEHIDERLERWFEWTDTGNIGLRNVGSPEAIGTGSVHFGNYDPRSGEVIFWNETPISIPEVLEEMRRIRVTLRPEPE